MGIQEVFHTAKTELFKFVGIIYNTFLLYLISILSLLSLIEIGLTYYDPYSITLTIQSSKYVTTALAFISLENFFILCSGYIVIYGLIKVGWLVSQSYTKETNYEKATFGAVLWQLICVISAALKQVIFAPSPSKLTYIHRPLWQVVLNLVITLIILPIQCYVEEYIFRGPIAETPSITILILSSILFAVLHVFNPEIVATGVYLSAMLYFLMISATLSITAYLTETIDYNFGAHFINNFIATFLFSSITSVFSGLSLFLVSGHGIAYSTNLAYLVGHLIIPLLEGSIFAAFCVEFEKIDQNAPKENFINKSIQAFSSPFYNFTEILSNPAKALA